MSLTLDEVVDQAIAHLKRVRTDIDVAVLALEQAKANGCTAAEALEQAEAAVAKAQGC